MTVQSRITLWVLGLAFVFLAALLQGMAPPEGWLAFEFPAWSGVEPATWTVHQRQEVVFGLGFDYLFIFVYAAFLTVLGSAIGGRIAAADVCRNCIPKLSLWIWAAAGADALENWGLYRWLRDGEGWLLAISLAAVVKYLFIVLIVILLVSGWRRTRRKR